MSVTYIYGPLGSYKVFVTLLLYKHTGKLSFSKCDDFERVKLFLAFDKKIQGHFHVKSHISACTLFIE